jgi:diguanylate cyclase (GGDEF)-like protein/PAS domain S-box-containing protein
MSDDVSLAGQLLAAVGQAVIATDLQGTVIYWNDSAAQLFGWAEAEALGRSLGELVIPAEATGLASEIVSSVLAGRTWTGEFAVTHRDGHVFRVLVTDSPIRNDDGDVVGIVGVSTDLTARVEMERSLRRSEGRLRARFEQSAMPQLALDVSGRITDVNHALCRLLDREADELLGQDVFVLFPLIGAGGCESPLEEVLAGATTSGRTECRGSTRDGSPLVLQVDLTVLRDPDGTAYGLDGHVQDLTGLRRAEQALRTSETRYRVIAETAQEGIWAVDLQGRALYVNQTTAELLRRDLSEVYAGTPAALLDIDPQVIAERVRGARRDGPREFDDRYIAPDGELRVLRVRIADLPDDDGRGIVGVLLMISDVTDIVAAQEELTRQALQDPLTGLGNRALLLDRLTQALRRAERRSPGRVAVLFADLDHLKEVNDSCGHAEGDALLREVANRFVGSVRPGDTVARLGGDEFVVLCEDVDESAARDVADRLLKVLAEPVRLDGGVHIPSASIGLAISPPMDPAELLDVADQAMYEAKRRGRARVVVRPGS